MWIEIGMCGEGLQASEVAPFAGVWIEISSVKPSSSGSSGVAPFAGVWIEIGPDLQIKPVESSHPSRVCGLKYVLQSQNI